jgi:flagellar motor switch protein FliG
MAQLTANLRKAAVFIRSLDVETAATLLAQLSASETQALRAAIRSIGELDPEEQADVIAEFRSAKPLATEAASEGVELALSSADMHPSSQQPASVLTHLSSGKRFEFLEQAPIEALVPHLSREQAQTIAVVLAHLPPCRAADVLAALPEKLQAETVERLAVLGETDPESVVVLESELAAWLTNRGKRIGIDSQSDNAAASILAAMDALTRSEIVKNLRTRNAALANQFAPEGSPLARRSRRVRDISDQAAGCADRLARGNLTAPSNPAPRRAKAHRIAQPSAPQIHPLPRFSFDELIHLDNRELAAVLSEVDSNVLVLALAGSTDALVDRVCRQMSASTARSFRRLLRKLGPTRLSDVESAQRAVAEVAARRIATRENDQARRLPNRTRTTTVDP